MFYYVSMSSRGARPSDMSGSLSPAPNTASIIFILHAPCQHQVMFSIFFRQICLAPMGGRAPLSSRNALLFIFSNTKKASTVIGTGFQAGDPREIRTPDTLIRSQVLYPAELLGHMAGAEGLKPPTYGFGDRCSINCAMPLSV